MAGLACTKPTENGQYTVEIPFDKPVEIAVAFLRWGYRHKQEWQLDTAKELACLSRFWDIPGEPSKRAPL